MITPPTRRLDVHDYHPFELACGFPRGRFPISPLTAEPVKNARTALELAVLGALERPPCVVSFSGGRDSSTVLALATHVAQREGLPPPLPVSLRFPGDADSDESQWQELVVAHLGLRDWQRVEFDEEMDVVGPYAEGVLGRHGLLYPVNTHFHVPILEHARGGSLLTGIGGDEVLSTARFRHLNTVLHGGQRPRPRDAISAVAAYGPPWLRELAVLRGSDFHLNWLTPTANRQVRRWRARHISRQQVRWDRWVTETWWTDRGRVLGRQSIAAIAADVQALPVHPLEDPVFLATVSRDRGAVGFKNRQEALDLLVGDLLPPDFSGRVSKASFNHSFFGAASRKVAAAWDGTGFPEDVIDPAALRRAWGEARVDARAKWLLQAVYLRTLRFAGGVDQRVH